MEVPNCFRPSGKVTVLAAMLLPSLRAITFHGDVIALLQRRPNPSPVNQAVRVTHFEAPARDFVALILSFDVQRGVSIRSLSIRQVRVLRHQHAFLSNDDCI
jgi:hypothetical protein